jgi:nitrous oxidase accessory protein
MHPAILSTTFLLSTAALSLAAPVRTITELATAVKTAQPGTTVELAAATFRLTQPLDLPTGLTLTGAGIGKTIITHADAWRANHATLPDPETNHEKFDRSGYLLRCQNDAGNIAISQLTLTGPALHGAIFGMANHDLHLHHLHIENFLFSGIRTYAIN